MNKVGHTIGGASAGIIVIDFLAKQNSLNGMLLGMPSFYTLSAIALIEASAYIGALFPDIDHPIATAGKKLKQPQKQFIVFMGIEVLHIFQFF